jgi:hypothetical protein
MNQDRELGLVCVGAGEELAKTTLSTWKSAGKEFQRFCGCEEFPSHLSFTL